MDQERELLRNFVVAKDRLSQLKEDLKAAQAEFDAAEKGLLDYLQESEKEATAKYEGIGYATTIKPQVYASCTEENKDTLFEFLKAAGREDLIKTVVNAKSLSGYVKELLEDGKEIPACISYYMKNSIRVYA